MHTLYDYKKFAVLYVDDEEKSLKYFTRAFQDEFTIFTANSALEGFKIFEEHKDEIAVLITDQRMPGEKGVQLLEKARQLRPKIIRMLATAFSDIDAAVDAVNSGAIYKYIHKPWDVPQLQQTLRRAIEFFIVQQERDQLLREKLSVLHNIMISDRVVSLGLLAAGLGHHIRNSLVAIRTFLDLAPEKLREERLDLDELRNPNFWKDFHNHVQKQLLRITELLTDLGLAAEGPKARFDDRVKLNELLAESLERIASKTTARSITIENNIPSTLSPLRADLQKMSRFFELLLKDEMLNLADGAKVTFEAREETTPEGVQIVRMIMKDNGPGLAVESMRSVFDPFFLRYDNPQEFGLNLMACFFIIYHHGGKIDVHSTETEGTTFDITLPINPHEKSLIQNDKDFLPQMLSNEALWEKLLAGVS